MFSLIWEVMDDSSLTLTLSGESSILEANYFPSIELSSYRQYALGLIGLSTFNSIPNIDIGCNKIQIGDKVLTLPTGSYELEDINNYIQKALEREESKEIFFSLIPNNNTLKSTIKCNREIDFRQIDSIASLLGFSNIKLEPNKSYTSSSPVKILKVNILRIECNITTGAYVNDKKVHTLHEFFPTVPPGFKIIEVPAKTIYYPITSNNIQFLQLKIINENGELVNFRGETITIRLHLKTIG